MQLLTLFDEAVQQVDVLVQLHDALVTTNHRAVRPEWARRFFGAHLVGWRQEDGLWRSHGHELLVVGRGATLSHRSFSAPRLAVFLRSALVLAMAAVDKILHEAISKNFMVLLSGGYFQNKIKIDVADCYAISLRARVRRGPGGRQRARPGPEIKREVMAQVYEKSYLSVRNLEDLAAGLGREKVLTRFGSTLSPVWNHKTVKACWSRLYQRRNSIAHEADTVRQVKARRVHFQEVRSGEIREDIEWIKRFGRFLAKDLPS